MGRSSFGMAGMGRWWWGGAGLAVAEEGDVAGVSDELLADEVGEGEALHDAEGDGAVVGDAHLPHARVDALGP
jgi:hypothetical protein